MTGDGKEEVVVERGKLGQLVLEHLRCRFGSLTLLLNPGLCCFGKDFVR